MVNVKFLMLLLVDFLVYFLYVFLVIYIKHYFIRQFYIESSYIYFVILSYLSPLLEGVSGKLYQLDSYLILSDIFNKQCL